MLTCSMMRFLSLLLLDLCACVVFVACGSPWPICEVVVGAVVAVTVMHVLLFVLHVCLLRG